MFKWGKREKQHFFKPTLCIRDKQKLAQGQKKPPKNFKKYLQDHLKYSQVLLTGKSPAAQGTRAPTLNTAHSWRETELTSHHTELPVCPQALHGDSATTGITQALWEASKQVESPKKTPKPTSLGLGNELGIWKPG